MNKLKKQRNHVTPYRLRRPNTMTFAYLFCCRRRRHRRYQCQFECICFCLCVAWHRIVAFFCLHNFNGSRCTNHEHSSWPQNCIYLIIVQLQSFNGNRGFPRNNSHSSLSTSLNPFPLLFERFGHQNNVDLRYVCRIQFGESALSYAITQNLQKLVAVCVHGMRRCNNCCLSCIQAD